MNEELTAKVDALRSQYEKLQDEVAMTDVSDTLGDIATKITGLPGQIQQIRGDGYAFANYLEHKTTTLDEQWGDIRSQIQQAIRKELENAQNELEELDDLWDALDAAIAGESGAASSKRMSGLSAMVKSAMDEKDEGGGSSAAGGLLGNLGKAKTQAKSGGLAKAAGALGGATSKPKSGALGGVGSALGGAASSGGGNSEANIDSLATQLEGAMGRLEKSVEGAKGRIRGLYGQVPSNVDQTMYQIREIQKYVERAQNAKFDWNAGEDMYMVVKAEWKESGDKKDDPDGFFYISNQRILMEQDEKKGGFMGFGGKKAEGLLWEAPIGSIEDISFEKKGMLGRIDLIHIKFGSGGPFGEVTVEVKEGDAKWFASKLKQAASGELEKERGLERDQALVDAIADAPTTCPVCGATFDQQIVRGMTQLDCSYCGSIVRLAV